MANCDNCIQTVSQYIQGGKSVCDRCFSTDEDMVCIVCHGPRQREMIVPLMSCPCHDNGYDTFSEWESDESDVDTETDYSETATTDCPD
jgi:hypothetical protein